MKKIITIALVSLSVLAVSGTALAFGGWGMGGFANNATPQEQAEHFTAMLSEKAQLFGVSIEQMKASWAEGMGIKDIAQEQGLSFEELQVKMQAQRKQNIQEHLQVLVNQGVITQAQADARLEQMENMPANGRGFGKAGFEGKGGSDSCPCQN